MALLLASGLVCFSLEAQTAHLVNGVTILPDGLAGYVAVDAKGQVYSTDATGSVLRQNIRDSVYSETVVATGFTDPRGVAIDTAGNVYVADYGSNRIAKVPFNGTTYGAPVSIGTGIVNPRGVAVDSSGNVYASNSANQVVKETLSGGTYTQSTIGSGFSATYGVAVDSAGNVYITDPGVSKVYKETLSGGTYTQSTVGTGLSNCFAVAVDGSGNVYLSDYSNNRILLETSSGGTYTQSIVLSGIMADSVAVDAYGNVFATNPTNNVLEAIQPGGVNFFQANVGSTSRAGILTFGFDTAGTIGSSAVLTNGSAALDFKDLGTGTCATNGAGHTYAVGDTCTINATLTPKYAGTRSGAATLVTAGASAAPFATAFVYGSGIGPQVVFDYATATAVIPTNTAFTGIVADGGGSVFLADDANKRVLKETPNGSGSYAQSIVASGLKGPQAIAIDGAGDLYVLDSVDLNEVTAFGQATMEQFKPQPSGSYVQTTVATGLDYTTGVAADSSGNVYTTDQSAVVKLTPLPGNVFNKTTIITNASDGGIAIDGGGNIFIAFANNGGAEYSPGAAGKYTYTASLPTYSLLPNGTVAVDGSGNLYISGTGAGDEQQVIRVKLAGDGTSTMSYTAGAGIITVDETGNIFAIGRVVAGGGSTFTGVYKLDQASPPTIPVDSAAVGTTGNPSDPIYFANIGNAPLNFAAPASGTNAAISANFVVDTTFSPGNDCPLLTPASNPSALAAGDQCRYFVDFAPTVAGALTGTLVATDDNLNVAGAMQIIHLTGFASGGGGPQALLSPASHDFGSVAAGAQSSAETFTLTNSGTAQLNLSGISITGSGAAQFSQTSTCGASLAPAGVCSISVIFAPTAAGNYGATLSVADDAGGSPQTAGLTGNTPTATFPQAVLSPTSLSFGSVATGTTAAAQIITLSNPGTGLLTVTGISLAGTDVSQFAETNNCGASLASGAKCTISITFTPTGDAAYAASVSVADNAAASPQTAQLTGTGFTPVVKPDFSIASSTSAQTVASGASATYAISLTPVSGSFNDPIALSVSGLPDGATASFSPASVTPGDGTATSTLTVATSTDTAFIGGSGAVLALGLLLLPWMKAKRLRTMHTRLLIFVLALVGAACASGCGAGGFAGHSSKTYVLTVTGTGGEQQHATTVTLIVK